MQASDESGMDTITGIIRVFVDAYPHIPEHRRLTLFSQLLHAVGHYKYLYVCSCLCVEALVTSTAMPDSSDEYEWKVGDCSYPLHRRGASCTNYMYHCNSPNL